MNKIEIFKSMMDHMGFKEVQDMSNTYYGEGTTPQEKELVKLLWSGKYDKLTCKEFKILPEVKRLGIKSRKHIREYLEGLGKATPEDEDVDLQKAQSQVLKGKK